jgi:double-strand break repair protein MRE11
MERDPVRSDDSYAAFEEALLTARNKKADFVLLAGDLFHENKPSRRTLHATFNILQKQCLGGEPVYIEVLNNQQEIFRSSSLGQVNFQNPYQSVDLPIFAIHGNHDDPSRDGGSESLSALDLLAVSNYMNYFGKIDSVEEIVIKPVLIRKLTTTIAIYGMGAIRDERLNSMWRQKKVKFARPTEGMLSFYFWCTVIYSSP